MTWLPSIVIVPPSVRSPVMPVSIEMPVELLPLMLIAPPVSLMTEPVSTPGPTTSMPIRFVPVANAPSTIPSLLWSLAT